MTAADSATPSDVFPRPLTPTGVVLAADARRGRADYTHDLIWALRSLPGPDGGLCLETGAGLQVQRLRLFPWLEHAGQFLQDPTTWAVAPALTALGPDYAHLRGQPLPRLHWSQWVWVAQSRVLWLRFHLTHEGPRPLRLRWALAADLQPLTATDRTFEPLQRGGLHVLVARVGEAQPLLFLTGGPRPVLSPYPALTLEVTLAPDETRSFNAVLAWGQDHEESLTWARHWAARPWEAVVARLRLDAERAPRVLAPRHEAFSWWAERGRQTALRLLHGPTQHLPHPFPVRSRLPEHGFSPAGTGADHPFAWSGLTVAEAWYAAVAYWLWADPAIVAGWVENFVYTQSEAGLLDGNPGLGGQRGRFLASPLLVDLAWRVFRRTRDQTFLARVFPALQALIRRWFATERDVDQDGWPEWQQPLQLGLADFPLAAAWHAASPGVDLRTLETPVLAAYLYRALDALESLAQAQGRQPDPQWAQRRRALRAALQTVWDSVRGYPHHRDRDTHASPQGRVLLRGRGSGLRPVEHSFDPPVRLVVQISRPEGTPWPARVRLRGRDARGRARNLVLEPRAWRWYEGRGVATATEPLQTLEAVETEGLAPRDRWRVLVPDLHAGDITLLAPLWAGMLTPEQAQAMMQRAIVTPRRFGQAWGLPIVPGQRTDTPSAWRAAPWLWNIQVIEGLWAYGFWDQAAALLYRLVKAHVRALQHGEALAETIDARSGEALGPYDTLSALPPLGPLLLVAGLEVAPRQIRVLAPSYWPDALEIRGWGWRARRAPDGLQVHGPGEARVLLPAKAVGVLTWQHGAWRWQPASEP